MKQRLLMAALVLLGLAALGQATVRGQETPSDGAVYLPLVQADGGDGDGGGTIPSEPDEPDPNEPDPNEPDPGEPDPNDPANDPLLNPSAPAVPGEYVIVWRTPEEVRASATAFTTTTSPISSTAPLNIELLDVSQLVAASDLESAQNLLDSYRNDPNVELIEPNYLYTATVPLDVPAAAPPAFVPNDELLNDQWAWAVVDAFDAWDVTRGSADAIVAVIDSGVQTDHPDLNDHMLAGYDFVDDDNDPGDLNGHGTHVAGTIAAETDNGAGVAGMCPHCSILPLRALNRFGSGSLADIASAIIYATDNGADVINLSLGGASSRTMEQAIDYAWNNGVFVTCAAGNSGRERPEYPAALNNCVAVAATGENDARAGFSNYGSYVELAAPGDRIVSTYTNGRYTRFSGTSMAAPHVAGLAGLLASQGLSNDQIRSRLCSTADAISGTGSAWTCGRINAFAAVSNSAPPPATPPATGQPTAAPPTSTPAPTSTPVPTAAPTARPTVSPTPFPPVVPDPNNAIVNGGFEAGAANWIASSEELITEERVRFGNLSARLGGENNSTDVIEQTVVVPADGVLSYYWSKDNVFDRADYLEMEVTIAGSSSRFSVQHNAYFGFWYRRAYRVEGLAGETLTVRFTAHTDDSNPTTFYVDGVALE